MVRRLAWVLVAGLASTGCYLSHELDDGGRPSDASLDAARDAGRDARVDLGRDAGSDLGTNVCMPGSTQPVPCGHCGTALRTCLADGTYSPPGECGGEMVSCGLDVMLLADTTGSHTPVFMASADALEMELIVPLERDADVRVGVAAFADYPVGLYGAITDVTFVGVLEPTHDVDAVNAAIRGITFYEGGDVPEALIEGLNDLAGGTPHPTAHPFHCTTGIGGGCWRPTVGWRVILVMTDVASHGLPGPTGTLVEPYGEDLVPPAPSWTDVRRLLADSGTYVYWIVSTDGPHSGGDVSAVDQAGELARELGEDPSEAVATYDSMFPDPAISLIRERMIVHFGLHVAP